MVISTRGGTNKFNFFLLLLAVLGDPRVNQNPGFLALGIVFYRWHNVQAASISEQHPDWSDEDVFQAARRRVVATIQVRRLNQT